MEKPIQFTGKDMPKEISFGMWLRQRRRMLDLTQKALADQVGCAEITVRQMEADALKPSKGLALILLEKLNVPSEQHEAWLRFARGLSGVPDSSADFFESKPLTNLPTPLSAFIGRKKEHNEVIELLKNNRLVTLTGVGGIGKTRLSIQVASGLLNDYPNGIWLVDLALLSDFALVPTTVLTTLGLIDQASHSSVYILIDFLRTKRALLILDNCEHLIQACAQLMETLLQACPDLHILATSREALSIDGEKVFLVPSLTTPESAQTTLQALAAYEAVQLFLERAKSALADFRLTQENAPSIAQVCHHLDGIPLAIELAAVRVKFLPVEEIAARLYDRFRLLTSGTRTALPRHQTLRAMIDWSHDLLSEKERLLFQRLAVFMGGWTLEAAEEICSEDGIESNEILDLVSQLVNKSLVLVEYENGTSRYRKLETIHQFARARLIESGEEESIRTRHLNYFLGLSKRAEPALQGPTQMEWYAWVNGERDNIRTALEWADKTDVEAGLYLSSRLGIFWYIFDLREGCHWLSKFLKTPESHTYPGARAKALYVYGQLLVSMQQSDVANSAATESLELHRALGDQQGEVDALILQASIMSDAIERMKLKRSALELAQSLGDVPRQVSALWQLGYSSQGKDRFIYWERAIRLTRSLGDVRSLAHSLSTMGLELALSHEIESAQKCLDESYGLYQQFNMNPPPRNLLSGYGQIALIRGDYEKARASFREEATTSVEYGNRQDFLWAHARVGYVALHEGNFDEARRIFAEVAQNFQKDRYTSGVAFALEGMAAIDLAMNRTDYAARLVGWSDATREKTGDLRAMLDQGNIDQIIGACLAEMGNVAFSKAYDKGKKMTLDEAVCYAFDNS